MLFVDAVSAETASTAEFLASSANALNSEEELSQLAADMYRVYQQPKDDAAQAMEVYNFQQSQNLFGLIYQLSPASTGVDATNAIREGSYGAAAAMLALEALPFDEIADVMRANKSAFGAFKREFGAAGKNMDWHHLVEQHADNVKRFGVDAIQNSDNLVRLNRTIHAKVTGLYNSGVRVNGMHYTRARDYVKTLSFQEQRQYSLNIMRQYGWMP